MEDSNIDFNEHWRHAWLAICFVFFSVAAMAQSGKLKIRVYAGGQAVQGAGVTISGNNRDGATDRKGEYEVKGIAPGTYQVKVTMLGYQTQEKEAVITDDKTTQLEYMLENEIIELQGVEITGRRERGYKNSNTFTATKTETAIRDIPQAVSYVTKELIDDQMAFKMMDVLKNISGVSQNSYTNNKYILRGFESESKQTLINGLKAFSGERTADILPYVERIEVLKGPASALFANASPGGTINTVTKKPLDEDRKAINFATGSNNTIRMTSDFTGPMNKSHTLLYRLNLGYQDGGSFRKLMGTENFAIAPSVSFIPDDKTRINFDLVYINDKGRNDRGQPSFSPVGGITDVYAAPLDLSLARVNDYVKARKLFSTLSLQRRVTDNIAFNVSYLKGVFHEDLSEHRTANKNAVDEDGNPIPDLMEMRYNYRITDNYSNNLTTYFTFNFNTGPLSHVLLTGYDFIQNADGIGNTTSEGLGYLAADGKSAISKYDPSKKEKYLIVGGRPVPNVQAADLRHPDYTITDNSRYFTTATQDKLGKYYTNGIYVQDQVSWNKFKALLALRQEFYTDVANFEMADEKKVDQQTLLPRIGLVYAPFKQVSLYGTYVYGFQPQESGFIGDPNRYGGPFDPLESNMVEFGAKSGWFNDRLSATVAVYQIKQNNVLQTAGDKGNPDLLRQIGQVRGRGVELDVYGSIMSNLSVTANLAFNKTEISKSEDASEIGARTANAPKSQGGIWGRYDFTENSLRGIGIALGANFQSDKVSAADNITLPAYTVANAALYYAIDKIKISATFNNIFNKTYWLGSDSFSRMFPGNPRNFLVGVGYAF